MQSTTATPQDQDWFPASEWLKYHEAFLARKSAGPIDLLFIGDSITQGWLEEGRAVWDREYVPMHAANFGIGGDETQHVLWRIQHGEIDGISPRVVVLKIGTNNIGNSGHDAEQTIAGIKLVVQTLQEKLPTTLILLLGLFPRDASPGTPHRLTILKINQAIATLDQGDGKITFLDLASTFLDANGRISSALMPDYLHLSEKAYGLWAEAMRGTLQKCWGKS